MNYLCSILRLSFLLSTYLNFFNPQNSKTTLCMNDSFTWKTLLCSVSIKRTQKLCLLKWISLIRLPREFMSGLWNVGDVIKQPYHWKLLCMWNLLFLVAFVIYLSGQRQWTITTRRKHPHRWDSRTAKGRLRTRHDGKAVPYLFLQREHLRQWNFPGWLADLVRWLSK